VKKLLSPVIPAASGRLRPSSTPLSRLELLEAEKELTRRGDELARRRQALPWVRIGKEYRFETDNGSASLADLGDGPGLRHPCD
jgi:predicted dithiol-disulfide oxidoreductase (DUF899 family)